MIIRVSVTRDAKILSVVKLTSSECTIILMFTKSERKMVAQSLIFQGLKYYDFLSLICYTSK